MKKLNLSLIAIFCLSVFIFLLNCTSTEDTSGIKLIRAGKHTVKVMIDGQHFTTYTLSPDSEKSIFFPLNSPKGNMITRNFPMIKGLPDESQDHKHHQSLWFTYGDINGVDFWNEPGDPKINGKIVPTKLKTTDGQKVAGMIAFADWVLPDGRTILKEEKESS